MRIRCDAGGLLSPFDGLEHFAQADRVSTCLVLGAPSGVGCPRVERDTCSTDHPSPRSAAAAYGPADLDADRSARRARVAPRQWRCQLAEPAQPGKGMVLAHFIVSDDVERSRRFYTEVLGGTVVFSGEVTYVALANSFVIINVGGGPTDDKPAVTLETPRDPDRVSSFLNIRVEDIQAVYAEWSARGAHFLTPPKQHQYEIRCYIRDPDGHLIEVGQTTNPEGDWSQWLPSPSPS